MILQRKIVKKSKEKKERKKKKSFLPQYIIKFIFYPGSRLDTTGMRKCSALHGRLKLTSNIYRLNFHLPVSYETVFGYSTRCGKGNNLRVWSSSQYIGLD